LRYLPLRVSGDPAYRAPRELLPRNTATAPVVRVLRSLEVRSRHQAYYSADVRSPSQASTMVPWHGRQTMEIEDDSHPEDDA
jgi:hypothetical protein